MKRLLLCLSALPAWAGPVETVMTNDKGAILDVYGVTDEGFDFTLSSAPCPEGETTCLVIQGHAGATPKGYTWAEGNSRIFFADTEQGVKVLQTAGDLGAGTANRAAKLAFPGAYLPDADAAAAMGDPGEGDVGGDGEGDATYRLIRSPTGNIGCMFALGEVASVRCDLVELVPSFPDTPQDCEFDYGRAFGVSEIDPEGEVLCYSDTVVDPGAEVLDYGASIRFGDLACWSEKTGMICENAKGHGFKISRKKQEVY